MRIFSRHPNTYSWYQGKSGSLNSPITDQEAVCRLYAGVPRTCPGSLSRQGTKHRTQTLTLSRDVLKLSPYYQEFWYLMGFGQASFVSPQQSINASSLISIYSNSASSSIGVVSPLRSGSAGQHLWLWTAKSFLQKRVIDTAKKKTA